MSSNVSGPSPEQRERFKSLLNWEGWTEDVGFNPVHQSGWTEKQNVTGVFELLCQVREDLAEVTGDESQFHSQDRVGVKRAIYSKKKRTTMASEAVKIYSHPKTGGPRSYIQVGRDGLRASFTAYLTEEPNSGPRIRREMSGNVREVWKELEQVSVRLGKISPALGLDLNETYATDSWTISRRANSRIGDEVSFEHFLEHQLTRLDPPKGRNQANITLHVPDYWVDHRDPELSVIKTMAQIHWSPVVLMATNDAGLVKQHKALLFGDEPDRAIEVVEEYPAALRLAGLLLGGTQGDCMARDEFDQSWCSHIATDEFRDHFLNSLQLEHIWPIVENEFDDDCWERLAQVAGCMQWRIEESRRLYESGELLDALVTTTKGFERVFGEVISGGGGDKKAAYDLALDKDALKQEKSWAAYVRRRFEEEASSRGLKLEIGTGGRLLLAGIDVAGPELSISDQQFQGEFDGILIELKTPRIDSRSNTKQLDRFLKALQDPRLGELIGAERGLTLKEAASGWRLSWRLHAAEMTRPEALSRPYQTFTELLRYWGDDQTDPHFPQPAEAERFDVMFSFNVGDKSIVDKISKRLIDENVSVWRYDDDGKGGFRTEHGDNYWRVSQEGVRSARLVVPVISTNYWLGKGKYCAQELWYVINDPACTDVQTFPLFIVKRDDGSGSVERDDLGDGVLNTATDEIVACLGGSKPEVRAALGEVFGRENLIQEEAILTANEEGDDKLDDTARAILNYLNRNVSL